MSLDVKALLDASRDASGWCPQCGPQLAGDEDGCCLNCGATATGDGADQLIAAVNALPDLLALAEAVQALTPAIRTLAHPTSDHPHAVAARRVLAILEPTNEGDGR